MLLVAGLDGHGVSLGDIIVALSVIGGWLIKYAQNNDKAEVHTKVLSEHGKALDKLTQAIHDFAIVDVRMDEQAKQARDRLKDIEDDTEKNRDRIEEVSNRVNRLEERFSGRYGHNRNP